MCRKIVDMHIYNTGFIMQREQKSNHVQQYIKICQRETQLQIQLR